MPCAATISNMRFLLLWLPWKFLPEGVFVVFMP